MSTLVSMEQKTINHKKKADKLNDFFILVTPLEIH